MWFFNNKSTGLIPQPVDTRDYVYKDTKVSNSFDGVDLRNKFPAVTDQNGYNSCTYHAVCALLDYELKYNKQFTSWDMNTSEAFLWYYGRKRLKKEKENTGTILRDAFKVIKEYGFVTQNAWDYKDGITKEPVVKAKIMGEIHKKYLGQLKGYFSIMPGNLRSINNALMNGHPVVFGMPTDKEYKKLGSDNYVEEIQGSQGFHAQLIVGYFTQGINTYYIVRNSWSNRWGLHGYSYVNGEVIKEKGFDLWTLR